MSQLQRALVEKVKRQLWNISPSIYHRFTGGYKGQRFSIGMYQGDALDSLMEPAGVQNPVLSFRDVTDVPAIFVADPFMLHEGGRWHMFFEVLDGVNWLGHIGWAHSADGKRWKYERIVIDEPFHLAYPYLFRDGGDVYMIPDSPGQGIRLYKAEAFPHRWRFVKQLRRDNIFSDSSVFRYEGRWWMLSAWAEEKDSDQSLRLFSAEQVAGPWQEHPASPVVHRCRRSARPCGRVQVCNNRVVRFAQDCSKVYGECVRGFEITTLTQQHYAERELPEVILQAGTAQWRRHGMHHLDAHPVDNSILACVDGWERIG